LNERQSIGELEALVLLAILRIGEGVYRVVTDVLEAALLALAGGAV
jgi:hypothetical protein